MIQPMDGESCLPFGVESSSVWVIHRPVLVEENGSEGEAKIGSYSLRIDLEAQVKANKTSCSRKGRMDRYLGDSVSRRLQEADAV